MADRGAILNRGVFPECLWLIWHFSLNPSRCLLCSPQLYLSIHLSLAFHCSNSRLPLFKHLSTHPTPPSSSSSFFLLLLARHFVSPFPRFLFKHSSGEFQSTYAVKRKSVRASTGWKNQCQSITPCTSLLCGCTASCCCCCLFPVDWILNVIRSDSEARAMGLWIA